MCFGSIWNWVYGKRARCYSLVIIPSAFHLRIAGREECRSVDMSRSLAFSPHPLALIYPNLMRRRPLTKLCFRPFVVGMVFRDAWASVKNVSKEDAQKAYVDELLKVRFISNACCPITGSSRPCVSQHILCSLWPPAPMSRHLISAKRGQGRPVMFPGVDPGRHQVEERGHHTEPFRRF